MPRINNPLYQRRYMTNDLYAFIDGEMRRQKITQAKMSKEIGCEQSTISKGIAKQSFNAYEIITMLDMLGYRIRIEEKEDNATNNNCANTCNTRNNAGQRKRNYTRQ